MAEKGSKDSTPPPLLLMPPGGGLTLNPPNQQSLFMPVVQSEPSLLGSDEEGEADSFVGQTPPMSASNTPAKPTAIEHFQKQSLSGSDPFSQIGHNPHPPTSSFQSQVAPPMPPPSFASQGPSIPSPQVTPQMPSQQAPTQQLQYTPNASQGANMFRKQQGKPKYAQMPQGTYAITGGQMPSAFPGQLPPSQPPSSMMSQAPSSMMPPFNGPPVAQVSPTVSQTMIPASMTSSPMPPKPQFTSDVPPTMPMHGGQGIYAPVQPHWCYCKCVEKRDVWYPFSLLDSMQLEEAYKTGNHTSSVQTDGGRYDVIISERNRRSVFWEEAPTQVRRCTWFFKREGDNRYVPYEEEFCQQLEDEYRSALQNNSWHRRLEFPGGETIVMHNANVIVHFQSSAQPDEWGTVQGEGMRPRVVKRGVDDFESIDDGEPTQVDHLVFVVHGIGDFCDVKFRNIIECVDDFRSISLTLLKSHFKRDFDERRIGRVEFLPVEWHSALHGDATGIDRKLNAITLPSTAKLRSFVNNTLMDILFYTSPTYCQTIADQVGNEMNRLYNVFLQRHPKFQGTVSVAGHSLGTSVLFDLLMHQRDKNMPEEPMDNPNITDLKPPPQVEISESKSDNSVISDNGSEEETPELNLEDLLAKVGLQDKIEIFKAEQIDMESLSMCSESDLKDLGLPLGPRKKLQGILKEETLKKEQHKQNKEKKAKEEEERKLREKIEAEMKENQSLKQSDSYLQRSGSICVEFLLGPAGTGQPYVHYPQLKFEPCSFFAMGSPIGIFLSARGVENIGENFRLPTCPRVYNIFHPFDPVAYRLEPLVNPSASNVKPVLMPHHKGRKRLHLELKESLTRVGADIKQKIMESLKSTWNSINEFARAHRSPVGDESLEQQVDSQMSSVMQELEEDDASSVASSHDEDIQMGQLNEGRRIDYVLQERPIESFNDYLFALSSHGCYWESEDTVLLVLKELYAPFNVIPQMPGPEGSSPKKLYNPAASPPRAYPAPSMSQFSTPGPGEQQTSVPLMAPTQAPPQNYGMPPMGVGMGTPRSQMASPYGAPPQMGQGISPSPRPATTGPPPLTGFVKGMQK